MVDVVHFSDFLSKFWVTDYHDSAILAYRDRQLIVYRLVGVQFLRTCLLLLFLFVQQELGAAEGGSL